MESSPGSAKPSKRGWLEACAGTFFGILAVLCFILGIVVLVIPFMATSMAVGEIDVGKTQTCLDITPATMPPPTSRPERGGTAYLSAWDDYVTSITSRQWGVQSDCEPMRFPSTASTYKGVVVIWHGFSSCTQEMTVLAPPLAAQGYDVLLPVLPGHGNELEFTPDGGFWLWGYITFAVGVGVLACLCCCRACPCCANRDCLAKGCLACGTTDAGRTKTLYGCSCTCVILVVVSIVAILMVVTNSGPVQCISLWPIAPTCGGYAEVKPNLPKDTAAYLEAADTVNAIVALASGERVLVGLSGGGALALAAGQAVFPGGTTALYDRQLLIAPYIGLQTFESILSPALSLGLGSISIHYGAACAGERRHLGKAGYCNIQLAHIHAMRQVAIDALNALATPPGTTVQIVGVTADPVVMNTRSLDVYNALTAEGTAASYCLYGGDLDGFHSPLSIWNYQDADMHWIGDVTCQLVAFMAQGKLVPQQSATAEGAALCSTPCADRTSFSCGWNCSSAASAFLTCA